jgi:hypothetical protein
MGKVLKFRPPTEFKEAEMFMVWCQLHPLVRDLIFHIPNEDSNINSRRVKKIIGQRNGVSDYFLPLPRNGYHGLWIELKRAKPAPSSVSADQQRWIDQMNALGYKAFVCHGCSEAIQRVVDYIS